MHLIYFHKGNTSAASEKGKQKNKTCEHLKRHTVMPSKQGGANGRTFPQLAWATPGFFLNFKIYLMRKYFLFNLWLYRQGQGQPPFKQRQLVQNRRNVRIGPHQPL